METPGSFPLSAMASLPYRTFHQAFQSNPGHAFRAKAHKIGSMVGPESSLLPVRCARNRSRTVCGWQRPSVFFWVSSSFQRVFFASFALCVSLGAWYSVTEAPPGLITLCPCTDLPHQDPNHDPRATLSPIRAQRMPHCGCFPRNQDPNPTLSSHLTVGVGEKVSYCQGKQVGCPASAGGQSLRDGALISHRETQHRAPVLSTCFKVTLRINSKHSRNQKDSSPEMVVDPVERGEGERSSTGRNLENSTGCLGFPFSPVQGLLLSVPSGGTGLSSVRPATQEAEA